MLQCMQRLPLENSPYKVEETEDLAESIIIAPKDVQTVWAKIRARNKFWDKPKGMELLSFAEIVAQICADRFGNLIPFPRIDRSAVQKKLFSQRIQSAWSFRQWKGETMQGGHPQNTLCFRVCPLRFVPLSKCFFRRVLTERVPTSRVCLLNLSSKVAFDRFHRKNPMSGSNVLQENHSNTPPGVLQN